ncbi:unnamed protein product [Lathyrus oleraceus]
MADPTTFIATWFTPSSIFIFVNLVIGTIALASRFNAPPKNQTNQQQPQLNPSPSLLQRVRSFNLSYYNNNESESESEFTQPQLVRKPSLLQRVVSFNFNKHEQQHPQTHYAQPESDSESTQPQLVRKPSLLQRVMSFRTQHIQPESEDLSSNQICDDENNSKVEMKKSASKKECLMTSEWEEEDEETVERRRPATAAARSETTTCKEDEAVDAKADDFINRFKKQLRLQRLDSFIRYRNTM